MARFDSYQWDHTNGVCKIHMLPSVPCPACLSNPKIQTHLYIVLDTIERSGILEPEEFILPYGFDPSIHNVY